MKFDFYCGHCRMEFTLDVSPYVPARKYGPPESCHPAEGGELDPDTCPWCGHPVDEGAAYEAAAEEARDRREAWLEAKADARREGDV